MIRRMTAELVGTATLCGFGFGGAVVAGIGEMGSIGLLFVAASWGMGLAIAIYCFGPASGAHLNPTVTLVLAFRKKFPVREVAPYVASQLAGAIVAAALVRSVYGPSSADVGLGSSRLGEGIAAWQGFAAEALAGFILVFVIYALAIDPNGPSNLAGLGIGMTLAAVVLALGPVAGASINFARTLGPDALLSLSGFDVPWHDLWIYLVAPTGGGLLAALLYERLSPHLASGGQAERTAAQEESGVGS